MENLGICYHRGRDHCHPLPRLASRKRRGRGGDGDEECPMRRSPWTCGCCVCCLLGYAIPVLSTARREGGIFRAPHIVQVSRENPSISCGCPCRTKATVLRRGVTFRSVLSFQPLSVLLSSRVARTRFLCSLTRSVYAFNFALCVAMTSFVSLRQPKIFKSIF